MNFVEKIRLLADFFEAHPELDQPTVLPDLVYVWGKEQMLLAAKVDGAVKEYSEDFCNVTVPIGADMKIRFYTDRAIVCEPLETKDICVPAQEAKIVKKVIKWKCHPLLEPTPDAVLHIQDDPDSNDIPF